MTDHADAIKAETADQQPLITGKDGKVKKAKPAHKLSQAPGELDGPKGPEPTRYGDWEKKGLISDF